jgi:hypothetical protein
MQYGSIASTCVSAFMYLIYTHALQASRLKPVALDLEFHESEQSIDASWSAFHAQDKANWVIDFYYRNRYFVFI